MGLLSLFQLNLRRPLVVKPEHAFTAPARVRDFSGGSRTRDFPGGIRIRDFTAGA